MTGGSPSRTPTRARAAAASTDGASNAGSSTRHHGLTRDDVVAAALELVEHGGPAALSMRRLAAELGVATTTIYWHVGNRDELVLSVIRRQADRQAASRVRGNRAEERIRSAARNIWRNALAHRNVTALANQAGATTLLELPLEVALVAELEDAGVRGAAARDALNAILGVIAGFLVMAWRRDDVPDGLRPAALWAEVDDERVSSTTRAALRRGPDLDRLFETTITSVVRGVLTDARNDPDALRPVAQEERR